MFCENWSPVILENNLFCCTCRISSIAVTNFVQSLDACSNCNQKWFSGIVSFRESIDERRNVTNGDYFL